MGKNWECLWSYWIIGVDTLPFDYIEVLFLLFRKIYQINGSIGHVDSNFGIITALKRTKMLSLWSGFEFRLSNIISYSLLFFLMEETQKNKRIYWLFIVFRQRFLQCVKGKKKDKCNCWFSLYFLNQRRSPKFLNELQWWYCIFAVV